MADITELDESLALEEVDFVDDTLESPVLLSDEREIPVEPTEGRDEREEIDFITSLITEHFGDEEPETTLHEELLRPIDSSEAAPVVDTATLEPMPPLEERPREEVRTAAAERSEEEESSSESDSERYVTTGYNMTCNCIFAKNEKVVRTYELIKKHPDSCIITNKRLIVNGPERVEVAIDRISGVKSTKFTEINWGKLIIGALFVIICLFTLFFNLNKYVDNPIYCYLFVGVGVLLGIIGVIMIIKSIHLKFGITIFCDAMSDIATFRKGVGFGFSNPTTVCVGKMGKDFQNFLQEFGAIILNINSKVK